MIVCKQEGLQRGGQGNFLFHFSLRLFFFYFLALFFLLGHSGQKTCHAYLHNRKARARQILRTDRQTNGQRNTRSQQHDWLCQNLHSAAISEPGERMRLSSSAGQKQSVYGGVL